MNENHSSLLYWFPKIKELDIPQPRTEILKLSMEELKHLHNERLPHTVTNKVQKIIDTKFTLPVFLRTDYASDKHRWERSCFYNGSNKLWEQIYNIIEFNLCCDMMGLPFTAIAIREYIKMESGFTAFAGNLPISKERRYFIRDGKVIEKYPYWPVEAIESSPFHPKNNDWRDILKKLNTETEKEVKLLTGYAEKVASVLDGYWSVDFCKAKDGRWILIDMAMGERSWRPNDTTN